MSKAKKRAWYWCSRYVRLRDALAYCKEINMDIYQFNRLEDLPVKCCTCGIVQSWIKMDAGHYIGRGIGGSSGVYFDERNIHAQSKNCNAFLQGSPEAYREFMLRKYGQKVIDELMIKHKTNIYKGQFEAIAQLYKELYKKLSSSLTKSGGMRANIKCDIDRAKRNKE